MLGIIVAKILLKGAIKTFILSPIASATMTLVPQQSVVQATMLNHDILISTRDLIKFGTEKLFDKYLDKKLDFQIKKISKHVFGILPADEYAALFTKEYADEEDLIVDLSKFELYLDTMTSNLETRFIKTGQMESEVDDLLNQVIQDLDIVITKSFENQFDSFKDEQLLVDEILQKHIKQIKPIREELPEVPSQSVDKEVDSILSKFKTKSNKPSRLKL